MIILDPRGGETTMSADSDRWIAERPNPKSSGLDTKPIREILEIINDEDQEVPEAVRAVIDQIEMCVEVYIGCYRRGGRIFYVGAGTSGRLGVLDAAECPPTFGVPAHRIQGVLAGGLDAFSVADENWEDDRAGGAQLTEEKRMGRSDFVIGITASGETPYVLGCIEAAKRKGARTAAVTTNPASTIVRLVDIAITPDVGPEVLAGSTRMKAGTAQKLILNMISTTAMVQLGKTYDNLMIDLQASNQKLRQRAERILQDLTNEDTRKIKRVLSESNYEVKIALLVLKGKVSTQEAEKLLRKHNGYVRKALMEVEMNGRDT